MQADTTIFVVLWVLFECSSFDHFPEKELLAPTAYDSLITSPLSLISIPSPPATSLKDIIEQERSQAGLVVNSADEVRVLGLCFVKAACAYFYPLLLQGKK